MLVSQRSPQRVAVRENDDVRKALSIVLMENTDGNVFSPVSPLYTVNPSYVCRALYTISPRTEHVQIHSR